MKAARSGGAAIGHGDHRTSYLSVVGAQLKVALASAVAYRVGFVFDGVLSMVWSLLGLVPLWGAFRYRDEIAGWDIPAVIVLTGMYAWVSAIFGTWLWPSASRVMEDIRQGSFDYALLRPLPAWLSVLTAAFQLSRILELFMAICLIVVGLGRSEFAAHGWQWLDVFAALVASLLVQIGITLAMIGLSFRALRLDNLLFLLEAILDLGRWPTTVMRGALRMFFTFVVPLGVMITFPSAALLGRLSGSMVAAAGSCAVVVFVLGYLTFVRGLASYTSASS